MYKYDRLFETMKKKNISRKYLENKCGVSKSLITRIKKGEGLNIRTLDKLCQILCCNIEDIVEIVLDCEHTEKPQK